MERKLYGVLKKHHGMVQAGERTKIKEHGYKRLNHPLRASEADRNDGVAEHVNVDDVVSAVADAAKVHPVLREHFSKDEVKAQVAEIFRKDASSVMDVERDWHARGHAIDGQGRAVPRDDHNPRDPAVKTYMALRHGSNVAGAEAN
jgi:hypothetical protein